MSDHMAVIHTVLFKQHNGRVNLEFYVKGSNHLFYAIAFIKMQL